VRVFLSITAVQSPVAWDVTPPRWVGGSRRSEGLCCLTLTRTFAGGASFSDTAFKYVLLPIQIFFSAAVLIHSVIPCHPPILS
jgi:hypothetical protein